MNSLVIGAVLFAGGMAAVARWGLVRALGSSSFPWGVLVANVVGSAVAGVTVGISSTAAASPEVLLVVTGGIAGGLTTFSTWSVDSALLARRQRARAVLNVVVNVVLGVAAASAGFGAGAALPLL